MMFNREACDAVTHLTFDCYGTLVDWESGILACALPLLESHGAHCKPEELLRWYVKHEARIEAQGWRLYREVLRGVMLGMAEDFKVRLQSDEADALAKSLPNWPVFSDTVESLQRLATSFRLVILSNTDDALFAETRKHLQVEFAEVITAEQVQSYKPGLAHFHEALRRLKTPAAKILHVAQSLYHDHVPARQLGFGCARVKRPSRLGSDGLALRTDVEVHLTVPDLATLADELTGGARA